MLKKKFFNYHLCGARRYIEWTFGILTSKWRIFHRPLNVKIDFIEDIIKACVVLHNFVRERDGYNFDHILYVEGLHEVPEGAVKGGGKYAHDIHELFGSYFQGSDGEVPWQCSKI